METVIQMKKQVTKVAAAVGTWLENQWRCNMSGMLIFMCMALLLISSLFQNTFEWLSVNSSERVIFIQLISFLVPCAVYIWKERDIKAFRINPVKLSVLPGIIMISVAIGIVVLFISSLMIMVLGTENELAYVDVTGGSVTQIGLFAGAILPALCEELLMRGVVLSGLKRAGKYAVLLSGILFAMLHGNLQNMVGPLIAGCAYGVLTIHYQSVLPAVLSHFIYNAYIFCISRLLMVFSGNDGIIFIYIANIVVLFACIYGIITYYEKKKLPIPFADSRKGPPPEAGWLKTTLLSPPFLLFYLLYIWKMVWGG